MNRFRRFGIFIIIAVIAAAIVYGFIPKPVPVETVAVERGLLRVTVDEEGKTRVKDRFVVSAPVSGYARRITLDVGDAVNKGAILVEIEPRRSVVLDPRARAEAVARVAAAEAALKAAREDARAAAADAEYAASELERIKSLFEGGFVSKDSLEEAEAEQRRRQAYLKSAEFAVEVAVFNLEAAKTALRYSGTGVKGKDSGMVRLRSPVSGRVLKVIHESEGAVAEGEPLVEIGDPRALEVEVDVLSEDSVKVAPGTRAIFDRWGGGEPLDGVVRVVEPAGFTKISALGVEEQRVLVISDITSPPEVWSRLGDGYRVEASFIVWEGSDVLSVPMSALFRHKGGWAVFVYDGNRARRRVVEVGHRSGLTAEILSGLKEGEIVITHPDDSIDDSTRVKPRK